MLTRPFRSAAALPHDDGFVLLEALVAILVVALGIFGLLGVQMRTLADTQTAMRRSQAIRLVEDLSERIRVHPNALGSPGAYVSPFSGAASPDDGDAAVPATPDCQATPCSAANLAAFDVAAWKQAVKDMLPQGDASIFLAPADTDAANRRQLGVLIGWRENERDIADEADRRRYRDAIDAARGGDGGAPACPEGLTCHLQYIAIAARCAPYGLDSSPKYFCPGA